MSITLVQKNKSKARNDYFTEVQFAENSLVALDVANQCELAHYATSFGIQRVETSLRLA